MPTYEYRCPEGHSFERFYRKMSDAAPELACPQCGKVAERQLTGGAGLVFKGSGFYLTDYGKNAHRKGPPSPKASQGGETGGGAKPSDSGTTDTKPSSSAPADSSSPSGTPAAAKPSKPRSDE